MTPRPPDAAAKPRSKFLSRKDDRVLLGACSPVRLKTKVKIYQYIFAQKCLPYVFLVVITLVLALIFACAVCEGDIGNYGWILGGSSIADLVVLSLLSILFVFLLSVVVTVFVIDVVYSKVEKLNGGPYKKGDLVYVISGRHKGELKEVSSGNDRLTVYVIDGATQDSIWSPRLIKMRSAEQGAPPDTHPPCDGP